MKPNAPQLIDINLIDAHPMNPRPEITPENVADLVGVMGDEYSPSHPIRVRQIGDRYQIIGGHRRVAASRIKGHLHIWCVVEVMGKEKAFMELVRDNAQKELDPLLVGVHAYLACDLSNGGSGIKGGISEYARQVGRDRSAVVRLRAAGKVAKVCSATHLFGMSGQLYEISRMPEPCWQDCVDWIIGLTADQRADRLGTVRDVSARVAQAMSLELPEEVKGTEKELTARMAVFMGKQQTELPHAISCSPRESPRVEAAEHVAGEPRGIAKATQPMPVAAAESTGANREKAGESQVHSPDIDLPIGEIDPFEECISDDAKNMGKEVLDIFYDAAPESRSMIVACLGYALNDEEADLMGKIVSELREQRGIPEKPLRFSTASDEQIDVLVDTLSGDDGMMPEVLYRMTDEQHKAAIVQMDHEVTGRVIRANNQECKERIRQLRENARAITPQNAV